MRRSLSVHALVWLLAMSVVSCRRDILPDPTPPNPEPPPPPAVIVETDPPVLTPIIRNISPRIQAFYTGMPARYNETDIRYPVIFFFHGGGQYGNGSNIDTVLSEGIPKLMRDKKFPPSFETSDGKRHSFIMIAPQFTERPTNIDIQALVEHIKQQYRIDTTRLYVTGFSLGGRVASDYAAFNPTKVAALVTMAGMSQINASLEAKCKAIADADLPVWHFHNRPDSAWYLVEGERFIQTINQFQPAIPARITIYETGEARLNHDSWTRATNPENKVDGLNIYTWLLQYKR
jgi:predicted peptidase